MAQEGHPHHGAPALAEIAPAPAGKGGMMCCKSRHGGDTVALEQRVSELEKRLDQMQKQLKPARKAP